MHYVLNDQFTTNILIYYHWIYNFAKNKMTTICENPGKHKSIIWIKYLFAQALKSS